MQLLTVNTYHTSCDVNVFQDTLLKENKETEGTLKHF